MVAAADPAEPDVARAVTTNGSPGTSVGTDALARLGTVCPYLRMADGSHRALAATRDHRCWAVEPPSTIPTATQADLCLESSHARCERYVAAQGRRAAGLASDHIPARLVDQPRFVIPVDPVPVVVDARPAGREQGPRPSVADAAMRRRVPLIAAGVGAALVGVVLLAALFGGLGGQPGPTPPLAALGGGASPSAAPTNASVATPAPTVAPTPGGTSPVATEGAVVVPQVDPTPTPYPVEIARTYLVKEGDTYRALAKRFGVKPRDLRALNGPLKVGERIVIPAEPWVTDAPDD
jgi:LysM repeat protein